MNAGELEAAMNAFRAKALTAIQALQKEQGRAAILVGHAEELISVLEIAISDTQEPQFGTNPSTQTHLSGLFVLAYQIFLPMLRHEQSYIDVSRDHALVLEGLCGEAAGWMQRAKAIVPNPQLLVDKRREVFSTLREIEMLALINPKDPNMPGARGYWEHEDAELRAKEAVQQLVVGFEPIVQYISDLAKLAQLQRGTWLSIGQDLSIAMAPMGDGGKRAQDLWTHSRVNAQIQLASIRRVAGRAAAYVAASEPHGFMTA